MVWFMTKIRAMGLLKLVNPWLFKTGCVLVAWVDDDTGDTLSLRVIKYDESKWFPSDTLNPKEANDG